jgi:hypothetical protein
MKREMTNMIYLRVQKLSGRVRAAMVPLAILAIWATNGARLGLAQQSAQPTFPSAAEATQNLLQAVQNNDEQAITNVLGGPTELTTSSDGAQDKVERELFVQKYQEMHRLGREPDGCMVLYIGAENWPFPISLIQKNGAWRFDPDTGQKEVMFRRIGENELTAIAISHELVAAEKRDRAKTNTANGETGSPASFVMKALSQSTGADPVLYQGYYFHALAPGQKNGGFAYIAYPAEYRSSGVMTFIVSQKDIVYEKDLGPKSAELAKAMTAFRKDGTWHAADE